MGLDAPPDRSFRGDLDRIRVDLELADAELVEMRGKRLLVSEMPVGMLGQAGDHRCRQVALAHIGYSLVIDDVIVVTGAQEREEVGAVLRGCRGEPCEVRIADLGTEAIVGFVAGPGVVHGDPAGA
jgi:hypothetical protein